MAIQFTCPNCTSPIEVDDEFADKTATCPYCRVVVRVPKESALDARGSADARPVAPLPGTPADGAGPTLQTSAPPYPTDYTPLSDPDALARRASAISWGNYALISAILAAVLAGVFWITYIVAVFSRAPIGGTTATSFDDMMKQSEQIGIQVLQAYPWLPAALLGSGFFAVVAVALSIVSLRIARNWRGVMSVVVGGILVVCPCLNLVASLVMFLAG